MCNNVATDEFPNLSRDFLRACQNENILKMKTLVDRYGVRDWSDLRHLTSGDTALHVAARAGNMYIVKYLCECFDMPEFTLNVTNKDMKRPLHEAAQFAHYKIVKYLLERAAKVDDLKRGDWTPLMLACTKSGPEACDCIRALLAAKADIRLRNKDGWTPLLIACRAGDENAVNLLLKHSPKCIDDRSNNGRSALHIAAFHGHEEVISLLVASCVNLLNEQDSSGSLPLHEAIKHGNLNTVKCIIHLGANVSLVDNVGQTILHIAALTGNSEVVEFILEHKLIDVNCETSFGMTPLMAAQRNNHNDVIKILTRYNAK
ncbi:ankyrin repeat domain-containing protein 16 [Anoplolepis gracilipes]|uniref:ankyrin repeat domain-containing protein 16 n=1 Tax=Anoplolepis gracilipes TaxID=354296 RepID=UPI003B9F16DC